MCFWLSIDVRPTTAGPNRLHSNACRNLLEIFLDGPSNHDVGECLSVLLFNLIGSRTIFEVDCPFSDSRGFGINTDRALTFQIDFETAVLFVTEIVLCQALVSKISLLLWRDVWPEQKIILKNATFMVQLNCLLHFWNLKSAMSKLSAFFYPWLSLQFFARISRSNIAFHRSLAPSFSASAFGSRCGQLRRTTSALSSEMPSTWQATRSSSSSALSYWSFRLSDAAAHNKKTLVYCSVWVSKSRDFIIHLFLVMPRDLNEIRERFLAGDSIGMYAPLKCHNYDKFILETMMLVSSSNKVSCISVTCIQ